MKSGPAQMRTHSLLVLCVHSVSRPERQGLLSSLAPFAKVAGAVHSPCSVAFVVFSPWGMLGRTGLGDGAWGCLGGHRKLLSIWAQETSASAAD